MWSDNETTVDYLNFGVVADACAKLLQQAKGNPISVGISGGWGVGKTSLVRMVEGRLKVANAPGKNTYVIVTFNPWLYQDFEGARSALPLLLCSRERFKAARESRKEDSTGKRLLLEPKLLALFPGRYLKVYDHALTQFVGLPDERYLEWRARAHLVVDFISGMTDDFAMTTYRTLAGMRL
jgi:hypothetical protein